MNAPTVSWRKPQKCRWKLMPQPDIEETAAAAAAAATHNNEKSQSFVINFYYNKTLLSNRQLELDASV